MVCGWYRKTIHSYPIFEPRTTGMECSSLPLIFNSLTVDSDYSGVSFYVTFPAGVNVKSFNVSIINDDIAECPELFTLALEIPPASVAMGVIAGSPDTATVNIMDDDGGQTD